MKRFSVSAVFCGLLAVAAAQTTLTTSVVSGGTGVSHAAAAATNIFTNPVIYEDLADNDVFRVDSKYYYTASTMHYSPGAPILESEDLVNWEYIGHAVPTLSWASKYSLSGGQAYVKGIYASTMRYRSSNGLWYWYGCIEYSTTYVYTASSPSGPWTQAATISTCFYDAGLLIDDDDTMYVAYGNTQLYVAELASDGFSVSQSQQVFDSDSAGIGTLEGSRFYKKDGNYYIFTTRPADGQFALKSSSPFGSYTSATVVDQMSSPLSGTGTPHQGSLVETPEGEWYYMAFVDAYPSGRLPVLAPVSWDSSGFPVVETVSGAWGSQYNYPESPVTKPSLKGTDSFDDTELATNWEWNHNPDTSKYSIGSGLTLSTVTVTSDLYAARNTLTHRINGGTATGVIKLDFTNMADGDRAGLAAFRDTSAYIAVVRDGSTYTVAMVTGLTQSTSDWSTTSTGSTSASTQISGTTIWLKVSFDVSGSGSKSASFSYSTDGSSYTSLGSTLSLNTDWHYFMGYRYGIFNYATKATGGSVTVNSFTQS